MEAASGCSSAHFLPRQQPDDQRLLESSVDGEQVGAKEMPDGGASSGGGRGGASEEAEWLEGTTATPTAAPAAGGGERPAATASDGRCYFMIMLAVGDFLPTLLHVR